jgi:hypothetical protein
LKNKIPAEKYCTQVRPLFAVPSISIYQILSICFNELIFLRAYTATATCKYLVLEHKAEAMFVVQNEIN